MGCNRDALLLRVLKIHLVGFTGFEHTISEVLVKASLMEETFDDKFLAVEIFHNFGSALQAEAVGSFSFRPH